MEEQFSWIKFLNFRAWHPLCCSKPLSASFLFLVGFIRVFWVSELGSITCTYVTCDHYEPLLLLCVTHEVACCPPTRPPPVPKPGLSPFCMTWTKCSAHIDLKDTATGSLEKHCLGCHIEERWLFEQQMLVLPLEGWQSDGLDRALVCVWRGCCRAGPGDTI